VEISRCTVFLPTEAYISRIFVKQHFDEFVERNEKNAMDILWRLVRRCYVILREEEEVIDDRVKTCFAVGRIKSVNRPSL
jgi:hypothetical protein